MNMILKILCAPVIIPVGTVYGACKGVALTTTALVETVQETVSGGVKEIVERSKKDNIGITIISAPTDFVGGTLKGVAKGLGKVIWAVGMTVVKTAVGGGEIYSAITREGIFKNIEDVRNFIKEQKENGVKNFKLYVQRGLSDKIKSEVNLGNVNFNMECGLVSEDIEAIAFSFKQEEGVTC